MIFHNQIEVHPFSDGKRWETTEWFGVEIDNRKLIFVPKDFILDFGSIHRSLWVIIGGPASGKYRRGAFVHDWLYACQRVSRKESDKIFLDMMTKDKVNYFKKYLIYLGVRAGGWYAWNSKTSESIMKAKVDQKVQFDRTSLSHYKLYA